MSDICLWQPLLVPIPESESFPPHMLLVFIFCAISFLPVRLSATVTRLFKWQRVGGNNLGTLLRVQESALMWGCARHYVRHGLGARELMAEMQAITLSWCYIDCSCVPCHRRFFTWLPKKWPSQFASSVPLSIGTSNLLSITELISTRL